MTFLPRQHAGEGREVLQPLSGFAVIAQQSQQCLKSFGRGQRAPHHLPLLFEPVRRGMAIGQPALDVVERDAEQRLARGAIGPIQLVRDQFVQRFHVMNMAPSKH